MKPVPQIGASGKVRMIEHVIPHVGPTETHLYSPADRLYEYLRKTKEVRRLRALRHVGALDRGLLGAQHSRRDYAAALVYYAEHLNARDIKGSFKVRGVSFRSARAALQMVAFCWNIGHLPGTFPVEKGVYRFLHERNVRNPADGLRWPNGMDD